MIVGDPHRPACAGCRTSHRDVAAERHENTGAGQLPGGGRGAVCGGDILTVTTDRKWLSFMRSYPNFIPLSQRAVEHIGKALGPFSFDAIYGHYFDRVIAQDGNALLARSVERYVAAIEGKRGY